MFSGIEGMQPPNLKGGGRAERQWSCYDPDRPQKEDYENIRMPSAAINAVEQGDLLISIDGGKNICFSILLFNFYLFIFYQQIITKCDNNKIIFFFLVMWNVE